MTAKLKFLGAARNVTGSCTLVDSAGGKLLVDCGLYQEREFRDRNWLPFDINPSELHAVLLTHAHLDHCGLIPRLTAQGFKGRVFCTPPSAEITPIVLMDSAHLQAEDVKHKMKRHMKEGRQSPHPLQPLYTSEDVENTIQLITSRPYLEEFDVCEGVTALFLDAGHIMGACSICLKISNNGNEHTVVFSGDIGRKHRPILNDPDTPEKADYLIMESTYGDRLHKDQQDPQDLLAEIITDTCNRGGNIVIPAFAIERSQEILYRINMLFEQKRIPRMKVFLDSPMAIAVTKVFQRHPEACDDEMRDAIKKGATPFSFKELTLTRSTDESKAINDASGSSIIIAGSGMCTGGRIKHHLAHNIERSENTILFVGYQASGTLGRILVESTPEVRILGQNRRVKARIAQIHGFSGHADRDELLEWLRALPRPPRHVYVTHGGENITAKFARLIETSTGWSASAPVHGETADIE